ncbi:RNA-binding KH domain-containing protein RCF3 [Linum perenne]
MERSRSKRNYYYDNQDYDNDSTARTKPRYNNNNHNHHYSPAAAAANSHHHNNNRNSRPNNNPNVNNRQSSKTQQDVMTTYRILCEDVKAGGVIGKSGSIIKAIRQHTGAWINVHELIPGDEERIIEITDTRRRDPEGRMPAFSPAQEALCLIHERILESDAEFGGVGGGYVNEDEEYGGGGRGGGNNRVATRLVVSRMHVGCLLGKGGKIIEQMRMETKTQIRVLPRDHTLPRCVSMNEEIVQVLGDANNVKSAIAIISSRLRESQHRDRNNVQVRIHSPERGFPDDDYVPHVNNAARRSSGDGHSFGPRSSGTNHRSNNYPSRMSGFGMDSGPAPDGVQSADVEELVFRILCPVDKLSRVIGENGILELLENEIGVDVKVSDPVSGSDEQIITISSEEGPDDELFPAQEALLHIQTRIVDLVPDQDTVIKTRLLVSNSEVGCLEGRESLSEMERLTGAKVQILAKEKLPACASGANDLVQIEGEIISARDALVEVTSRLRSYLYRDFFHKDTLPVSAHGSVSRALPAEAASSNNVASARESHSPAEPSVASYQTAHQQASTPPLSKDFVGSVVETARQNGSERREDVPASTNRIPVTLVTRSILEVVIPEYAVPKLVAKSKNKLTQISELSGANIILLEDSPDVAEKIIRISGTPEQAERAQSLLQGFILSSECPHKKMDLKLGLVLIIWL